MVLTRTLYVEVINEFPKVCNTYFVTAYTHSKFWPYTFTNGKSPTVGTVLFLISLRIERYKLCSHVAYCTELTMLCLQKFKAAEILVCAFSVHLSKQLQI